MKMHSMPSSLGRKNANTSVFSVSILLLFLALVSVSCRRHPDLGTMKSAGGGADVRVSYAVSRPKDMDSSLLPGILAVPVMHQRRQDVFTTVDEIWSAEIMAGHCVVICPSSGADVPIFGNYRGIVGFGFNFDVREFFRNVLRETPVLNRKFNIVEFGLGGTSAFYLASNAPEYVEKVILIPSAGLDLDELVVGGDRAFPKVVVITSFEDDSSFEESESRLQQLGVDISIVRVNCRPMHSGGKDVLIEYLPHVMNEVIPSNIVAP